MASSRVGGRYHDGQLIGVQSDPTGEIGARSSNKHCIISEEGGS